MKENKSVTEITGLVIIYIVNSIIIVSIIPLLIPLSGFTPIIFVISSGGAEDIVSEYGAVCRLKDIEDGY
jgi:hypothetical protein